MANVAEVLELLENPKKGKAFLSVLAKRLSPEDLRKAIRERRDLVPLLLNHLHLAELPGADFLLAGIWDQMEPFLTSVPKARAALIAESRFPGEFDQILSTEEARQYLNWLIARLYNFLYDFTFG